MYLQAAFHVVRFAIKLRSFSRLHQLKHVTWDDGGMNPPMETTGLDEDPVSSEVDTVCSSEEPQLNASFESSQSCVLAEEAGTEEEVEAEKGHEEEENEEVEHTSQTIGSLKRLALEVLGESEIKLTVNRPVDGSMSCEQLKTVTFRGSEELDIVSTTCTAAQYQLACSQSGDGDALLSPAQQVEDASRSGEQASANSELVLGFSELVHLMHACRCNGDVTNVSHYHERDATVSTGGNEYPCHVENAPLETDSDRAERSHVPVLNGGQQVVEKFSGKESLSQDVATSGVVEVRWDDFKQVKEQEEDTEQEEEVTAHHSTQEQVMSAGDEEVALGSHTPTSEVARGIGVTEDASAMPVVDAWVSKIWDASKPVCDGSSKESPPSTDHQMNALMLESSGQTDSSPAASPSELWRNESD